MAESESDNWDSDPDFVIPPGPFSLSVHLTSSGTSTSASDQEDDTTGSSSASALFSNSPGARSGLEDNEDYSYDQGKEEGAASTTLFSLPGRTKDSFADGEGNVGAEMEGERTKEEMDQSSTESRNGTIKALLNSFSGLSLASPSSATPNPLDTTADSSTTANNSPSTPVGADLTPPSSSFSTLSSSNKMTTLRLTSSLSALIASANQGTGKVTHLGSTPQGQATSWDNDLDLDLDLSSVSSISRQILKPKGSRASFSSHISDDPEDELLLPPTPSASVSTISRGLPTPKTSIRRPTIVGRPGGGGSTDPEQWSENDGGDGFDENDFDLPNDLAIVTLSPLLNRPSMTSLLSAGGSSGPHSRVGSSSNLKLNTHSNLQRPSSTNSNPTSNSHLQPLISPVSSTSPPVSTKADETDLDQFSEHEGGHFDGDDDAEDEKKKSDEAFFEDIVLPSYFVGGPGNVTPPEDEVEGIDIFGGGKNGGKIDLQAVLKRKLEAREKNSSAGGREAEKKKSGLDGFREKHNEDFESGLVVEGVKLGMERIRTRSLGASVIGRKGIKSPSTSTGSRTTSTSSTSSSVATVRRPSFPSRTSSSSSSVPVVPSTPPASSKKPKTSPPRRQPSSTSLNATHPPRTHLPHLSSSAASTSNPNSAATRASTVASLGLGRPSSAQGLVARERRAAGPPPAPSTTMRDRVRNRTISNNGSVATTSSTAATAGRRVPPSRIDTTRTSGSGQMTLSPVVSSAVFPPPPHTPLAQTITTMPQTPTPTPNRLRTKKSHGHLLSANNSSSTNSSSSRPATGARLERKRSLQNLSSLSLEGPSGASSSRRPLRSPTPGSSLPGSPLASYTSNFPSQTPRHAGRITPTTPQPTSAFARPTAASASRVRERVVSGPSTPTPSLVAHVSEKRPPTSHLTTPRPPSASGSSASFASNPPTSATTTRLTKPTLASASKARSTSTALSSTSTPSTGSRIPRSISLGHDSSLAGINIPSAPLQLSRPKRGRVYGDGTELDMFDDLPTNRERENLRGAGVVKGEGKRKLVKGYWAPPPSSSSTTSTSLRGGARGGGTAGARSATGAVKRAKADSAEESTDKRIKSDSVATPAGTKQKRDSGTRKEPQLIRNLGGVVPKVYGEMKWNALQHRWEGNESVLRDFDKALGSSTRPALITQLSSQSPNARVGFPSSSMSSVPAVRTNIKVVGGMVFDPVRMSWYSIDGDDEEDQLDLTLGDLADDENDFPSSPSGGNGSEVPRRGGEWEKGEQARMLNHRASFAMSDTDGEGGGSEDEAAERRKFWKECVAAEKRHLGEMEGWSTALDSEGGEDRAWLWSLRGLIMDSGT